MLTPKRGLENDYRITITGSHYKWLLVFISAGKRRRVSSASAAPMPLPAPATVRAAAVIAVVILKIIKSIDLSLDLFLIGKSGSPTGEPLLFWRCNVINDGSIRISGVALVLSVLFHHKFYKIPLATESSIFSCSFRLDTISKYRYNDCTYCS